MVKVSADKVINQLVKMSDVETMKKSVKLSRTGIFKSRKVTVTVGKNEYTCTVQELISKLGKQIKNPDGKRDVETLKKMLTAVSTAEKENRDFRSIIYHIFSKRDVKVEMLQQTLDLRKDLEKGLEFSIFTGGKGKKLSKNLLEVQTSASEPVPGKLKGLRKARIFIQFESPISKYGNWANRKRDGDVEAEFYIYEKDIKDKIDDKKIIGKTYVLALANEVKTLDGEVLSNKDLKDYILSNQRS